MESVIAGIGTHSPSDLFDLDHVGHERIAKTEFVLQPVGQMFRLLEEFCRSCRSTPRRDLPVVDPQAPEGRVDSSAQDIHGIAAFANLFDHRLKSRQR